MARVKILLTARKISVIILATLGVIVLVSGMLLDTMPSGPGSSGAEAFGILKEAWEDIHIYASFALAGGAVVHAYTNYRGILYHLGILKIKNRLARKKSNGSV